MGANQHSAAKAAALQGPYAWRPSKDRVCVRLGVESGAIKAVYVCVDVTASGRLVRRPVPVLPPWPRGAPALRGDWSACYAGAVYWCETRGGDGWYAHVEGGALRLISEDRAVRIVRRWMEDCDRPKGVDDEGE
jgi:hypothetical protein